ncbi:MAG: DNA polymerase I [Anaerolineaceae bacterium]|nr:DNA polymerase I [Anaerolineaceae bacterium]
MPPVLYLIDGHALAYRTFFALTAGSSERLQTRSGEPTAGIFGFASVLLRLLEQERPEYLAVAFDTGKTFRNTIFPDYKATRAKMPDDLRPQIERIRQLVDAFGFPRLEVEGYEADDVLGTVARLAVEQGFGVKIITGDRDLLQLVADRVIVNLSGKKLSEAEDYTIKEVEGYLGVLPEQVVDYKALVGDKSDNIPGVPGIGEKTAVTLLKQFFSLQEIYNKLDEIKESVRNKLAANRDLAFLSRDLAQIHTDVPLTVNFELAHTGKINFPAVEQLFQELEFRTLITRFRNLKGLVASNGQQLSLFESAVEIAQPIPLYQLEMRIVNTPETLEELKQTLESALEISFDTETTAIDPMRADLVGISLSTAPGSGYYIPVGHQTTEPQLPLAQVIEALRPSFTNPNIGKVGQNLKYDFLMLSQAGLDPKPLTFDTMLAEWLTDPASRHLGLKDMAAYYLNIEMTHIEELIGKGKNQRSMADVPVEIAAAYAAADAEIPLRLKPLLIEKMNQQNATRVFEEVEIPLISVLAEMEETGIMLDSAHFAAMAGELNQRLAEIEKQIYQVVGYSLNLNSTQQLSKALFETLHLQPPDPRFKTSSGKFSTSAGVLEELREQHPIIETILEYRELSKLKSTYVDSLPQQINPRTGRVHTSFSQTGSVTGRLASSDPNLQNIPTRTDMGRRVRDGFITAAGMRLLSVDYSQIELRIVAHLSDDKAMLDAFRAGLDIHAATAAAIYNILLKDVTKDQRRHAKAINFGLIYGMSPFGLSRTTDLTLAEAENFAKAYFEQFPRVKKYLDKLRITAAELGYVETVLGRRRYFPNLKNPSNANIRNREEREAINAPVQGSAADIMKLAMIAVPPALKKADLKARLLLQVHDELLLECPIGELQETARVVQSIMENTYPLQVPLETDARWGKNWGNMQPLATFGKED